MQGWYHQEMISHKLMSSPVITRHRLDPLSLLLSALEQGLNIGDIIVSGDNDNTVEDTPVNDDRIVVSAGGVVGQLMKYRCKCN